MYLAQIILVYLLLSAACFLMLRTVAGYAGFKDGVQFLAFKPQATLDNPVWKVACDVHVFSAVIALFAGFTQFSNDFLKTGREIHRLVGKIYVFTILVINFPAGMILAVYANGMLPGRTAFVTLDCLWFFFTLKAYSQARARNFKDHRRNMIRSYALTLSAITLRLWKMALSHSFDFDPLELYIIDAWMGFLPNLMAAEWLIRRKRKASA